jgi:hypothetical protein
MVHAKHGACDSVCEQIEASASRFIHVILFDIPSFSTFPWSLFVNQSAVPLYDRIDRLERRWMRNDGALVTAATTGETYQMFDRTYIEREREGSS